MVNVYDSAAKYSTHRNKEEIAALLHTTKDTITLQYMNVQHQYGGSDCGLYALAFAAALCAGIDPTACIYLQPGTDERTLPDLHHKGTDRSIPSQAIT